MFGSFSSWKVFHQNVDLDWGRGMNFSIYLFSVFCFFTVHFSVCITLLYISYFSILNLECKVGSTHLSSLWNWRHFSAWISGMRTWAKKVATQSFSFIIQLQYYKKKIQKWANSLVGLKTSQLNNLKIRIFLDIPSTLVTANRPRPQIGANLENNSYKLTQK